MPASRTLGRISGAVYVALFGFAFVAAPYACEGGLEAYAVAGLVGLVGLGLCAGLLPASPGPRTTPPLLWVVGVVVVWIAGLFVADVRLMCRLF